jgi:GAF domain-containing protein
VYFEPAPIPDDESRRQHAIRLSGALDIRDDPVLDDLAQRARGLFGTAMAAVTIIYNDWQYIIAAAGMEPGVNSRRTSFCGHTVAEQEGAMIVTDARADERFVGNPHVEDGTVGFYAGAVLRGEDGTALGAFCVFDSEPRPSVSDGHRRTLEELARAAIGRIEELRQGHSPS